MAMGCAFAATLGEGETFTTVELKINFFRPMGHGKLTTEAKVIEAGSFRWVPYFATGRQTL
jgi:acyl-coenzyme A thioesterase PaaI-like protein